MNKNIEKEAQRTKLIEKNEEDFMAGAQKWKKEFSPLSFPRLIDCPLQPGNLKISEKACLKRYQVAQNRNMENGNGEDIFNYFLNQGLLKCQRCPIVKTIASYSAPVRSDQVLHKRGRTSVYSPS